MKKRYWIIVVLVLALLVGCERGAYLIKSGDISKTDSLISGDYENFRGYKKFNLQVDKGIYDFDIDSRTEEGDLEIYIDGISIFDSNQDTQENLVLALNQDSSLKIEGKGHKGEFSLSWEKKVQPEEEVREIFLYGEGHGIELILNKEFQIWKSYYDERGMRDLFVELPFYTSELLNIWMTEDNDEILDYIYDSIDNTQGHFPAFKDFYRRIKTECPETVFHGTDVGHFYDTMGAEYLTYLEENSLLDSENYSLAQEVMKQGEIFYSSKDMFEYREKKMVENFVRAYDSLENKDIMGIYGGFHTDLVYEDNMISYLNTYYEDSIFSNDLSNINLYTQPIRIEKIQVGDREYEASYFGMVNLSKTFPELKTRKFWRLENTGRDFDKVTLTGDKLPYNNYPMPVEEGQVFVIEYESKDGGLRTEYYKADGSEFDGLPSTANFTID